MKFKTTLKCKLNYIKKNTFLYAETVFVTTWTNVVQVNFKPFYIHHNNFSVITRSYLYSECCASSLASCLQKWPEEMLFLRSCEPGQFLQGIPSEVSQLIRHVRTSVLSLLVSICGCVVHDLRQMLFDVLLTSFAISCGRKIQNSTTWCIQNKAHLFGYVLDFISSSFYEFPRVLNRRDLVNNSTAFIWPVKSTVL